MEARLIEWDRVAELREEVGEDDFRHVVALFLEEVEDVLSRICGTPGCTQLECDLHLIKSSALTLGFAGLAEVCRSGEAMAARQQCEGIDLAQVASVYHQSKTEFIAEIGVPA